VYPTWWGDNKNKNKNNNNEIYELPNTPRYDDKIYPHNSQ
jgi:hypothetical protein